MYLDPMRHDGVPTVGLSRRTAHVARKEWTCAVCRRTRPANTRYVKTVLVLDGVFSAEKTCIMAPDCECPCLKEGR